MRSLVSKTLYRCGSAFVIVAILNACEKRPIQHEALEGRWGARAFWRRNSDRFVAIKRDVSQLGIETVGKRARQGHYPGIEDVTVGYSGGVLCSVFSGTGLSPPTVDVFTPPKNVDGNGYRKDLLEDRGGLKVYWMTEEWAVVVTH